MMENTEPKSYTDLKPDYTHAIDMRGEPMHVCLCGSNVWNVKTLFENYEIVSYFIDMECAVCGSLATAPTPDKKPDDWLDKPHFCDED